MRNFPTVIALAAALALVPLVAGAGSPSPADRAAVANFRLTDSFLQHDQAMALELAKMPCGTSAAMLQAFLGFGSGRLSLDEASAQITAAPGMQGLLAKHGLTARDALLGGLELLRIKTHATASKMRANGADVSTSSQPESPTQRANDAFIAAHRQEIQQHDAAMRAIAQQRAHDDPGAAMACLGKLGQGSMKP